MRKSVPWKPADAVDIGTLSCVHCSWTRALWASAKGHTLEDLARLHARELLTHVMATHVAAVGEPAERKPVHAIVG